MIHRLQLALLLPPLLVGAGLPSAVAEPQRPAPPRSVPRSFAVNPEVCKPDRLRSSWRQQLQPWADQSEAVRAQLQRVQADLMAATLRRCLEQGLLSPQDADQLATELGLVGGAQAPPVTRP